MILELRYEHPERLQGLPQIVACGREKARLGEIGEFQLMSALLDLALKARIGILELRRIP